MEYRVVALGGGSRCGSAGALSKRAALRETDWLGWEQPHNRTTEKTSVQAWAGHRRGGAGYLCGIIS
jgi:hypothetical protein